MTAQDVIITVDAKEIPVQTVAEARTVQLLPVLHQVDVDVDVHDVVTVDADTVEVI